jgi:hypothetical protein
MASAFGRLGGASCDFSASSATAFVLAAIALCFIADVDSAVACNLSALTLTIFARFEGSFAGSVDVAEAVEPVVSTG